MKNVNRNKLCAVDVTLTGHDLIDHQIVQLCIIPLDDMCVMSDEKIFSANIINTMEVDTKVLPLSKYNPTQLGAVSGETVLDALFEWFESFKFHPGKKIIPICYNWALSSSFLRLLLGTYYDCFFTDQYRDIMSVAIGYDDMLNYNLYEYIYQKYDRQYIARQFRIKSSGDILWRTAQLPKIYKGIIKKANVIG